MVRRVATERLSSILLLSQWYCWASRPVGPMNSPEKGLLGQIVAELQQIGASQGPRMGRAGGFSRDLAVLPVLAFGTVSQPQNRG